MNVFDYFSTQPAVPAGENSRFWQKADGLMRQAGLDPLRRHETILRASKQLEAGQDSTQVLQSLKSGLPAFSLKREFADFWLFLAVYAGGLEGAYEQLFVPLTAGSPVSWQIPVSAGLILQCLWIYGIFKGLLFLLAFEKPGPKYWAGIILAFLAYLTGIWLCSFADRFVFFRMPVLLLICILGVLAFVSLSPYRRK